MQSILITGGTGYVGSHTSLELLKKGYRILILDSNINSSVRCLNAIKKVLSNNNISLQNNLKFIRGDIRDQSLLNKIFMEEKNINNVIMAVMHFAGLKSVTQSLIDPIEYWDVNVNGTINLLKIMKKFSCFNLVFSSSATIYSQSSDKFINEYHHIGPINPYGNTKATVEKLLNDTYNSDPRRFKIANLRYFNPIGAHSSGLLGEDPISTPTNIFPLILSVAAKEKDEIFIFGNDWNTPDGTGVRDYIHVMDVAEGHLRTLNFLLNNNPKIINLNLGTGCGYSVLQLIKTFEKINKVEIPYSFKKRRFGDQAIVVADNSLAKNVLNWIPKRNLDEMCKDGWNWKKKNSFDFENK